MKIMSNILKTANAVVKTFSQEPDIILERSDEWNVSNSDEWAQIIHSAKGNGILVEFKASGIHMSYGKHKGVFGHPSELGKARDFVKDLI